MKSKGSSLTPAQALEKLDALYEQSVQALRSAIGKYIETGELPDLTARSKGLFVYPSLSVTWDGNATNPRKPVLMGVLLMQVAIPRPSLVRDCSAPIWKNSSRCCIRITTRRSPSSHHSMRSPIRT